MVFLRRLFNLVFDWLNSTTNSRPRIQSPNRIPPNIRQSVWLKYNGDRDYGACYSCGLSINRFNAGWHCSHVIAHAKGGSNTVNNLRPCCRKCNLSMGDQNLYAYIKDKKLTGPGSTNMLLYFLQNPSQVNDKRTNNWGK